MWVMLLCCQSYSIKYQPIRPSGLRPQMEPKTHVTVMMRLQRVGYTPSPRPARTPSRGNPNPCCSSRQAYRSRHTRHKDRRLNPSRQRGSTTTPQFVQQTPPTQKAYVKRFWFRQRLLIPPSPEPKLEKARLRRGQHAFFTCQITHFLLQFFKRAHFNLANTFAADVILCTEIFQRLNLI